jgi:protein involved in polysaccharide export with SLBB domain
MLDNEAFSDLLKFSGGFTDNAYRGGVSVVRITDSTKTMVDLHSSDYNTFKIAGSDQYTVTSLQDEFGNRIVITGSVLRPGPYELTEGMTVKDLMLKAGGPTVDAFTKRATIFRYFKNKMPTILSVNIDSILDNNQQVFLQKNDSLAIHSIFDFRDSLFVSIEGNVRNPGLVKWRENMSLRDLILAVGGLTELGDSSNIEISRRIKDANVGRKNHDESQIFNVNLSSNYGSHEDVILQPFDLVVIKNLPGYTVQRSVLVVGEIKAPGKYGLQKSGDRISDVFKRTGGFKASADSSSITIRRNIKSSLTLNEREKLFQRILNINSDSLAEHQRLKDELYKSYDLISIDLTKALTNPKSSENLILEDGDILTIERSSNLVKVSGEVYYPTIVPYQPGKNLKYYVEKAGSFMPYARKNGALVIGSDGQIKTVKHFLWFKSYPEVGPRSEIFVPQKQKTNRTRIGAAEWALIVSALGIAANVFLQAIK